MMNYHAIFLMTVITSIYLSVCRAKFTIVANDTTTSYGLGCNMATEQQECTWKGPNSQLLTINATETNKPKLRPRVWVEQDSENLHCHLYFAPALLEDEGIWECVLDGKVTSTSWELIVQVRPDPPIIMYANGTSLTKDSLSNNDIPDTLPLKCFSGKAKPKQKSIRWLVNGITPAESHFDITGSPEKFFNATTFLNVTFPVDHQPGLVVKNVTCVVLHLAGETSASAIIKIQYPNSSSLTVLNIWLTSSVMVVAYVSFKVI